ncbi:hypothetical protein [Cognaticolwellia aestuarii]|uniref:hypothetical protein n=1 Tax=Cognaticolwellia aestuarii TaxID=329993 RepID=UPI000986DE4C|nr:hypothetical protein [Cognaticolwellia aestuarii]
MKFTTSDSISTIYFDKTATDLYPNHLQMQDSASRKRVSTKALIERNGCSIVEINNAGDAPLSPCPAGAKLENQCSVAYMDVCT